MEILKGVGVSKTFGGLSAITNIDFHVDESEIVGLIGPNGSGKTTLINLVTGVYPLSAGEIWFKGEKISGVKAYRIGRMGVARTFQIAQPFAGLTIKENILVGALFGRGFYKNDVAAATEKTEEALRLTNLWEMQDRIAVDLNVVGRKQLELAKALAMDPELLFLDEVMAGLNPTAIGETMELIQRINREKKITIVVVEHVMKAIMGISHRIMVLHHGEKIADGTPREIVNNDRVVEAYLGKKYAQLYSQAGLS